MKKTVWTITESSAATLKLEPGKNDLIRFDTTLPGFGVRVRRLDSGAITRSYVYQYKIGGKHYRDRLGHVGAITAKQARKMAGDRQHKLKDGINPKEAERAMHARSTAPSLNDAVEQYLEAIATTRRESTRPGARRYLRGWQRKFGDRLLDEITPREAAAYLVTVKGDAAANRAAISLSAMYVWARQRHLCSTNPVTDVAKRKLNDPRDRVLSDKELVAIWQATNGDQDYDRVVPLILLTGCRRNEIAQLKWSEVDLEAGTILIAKERSKNRIAHLVPLVVEAKTILAAQPRTGDNVFGTGARGLNCFSYAKQHLDHRLQIAENWQLRDLRRTVRSGLSRLGVAPHVAEAVINHVPPKLIRTYDRYSYINEKREALERWASHIKVLLAQATGANVTALRA
jgi:integrase